MHTDQADRPLPQPLDAAAPEISTRLTVENLGKSLAIAVSIISIYAWVAGKSYAAGYWGLIGWDSSIVEPSVQATAYLGFVGPAGAWWWFVSFMFAVGVLGLVTELVISRHPDQLASRPPSALGLWLKSRPKIDPMAITFFGGSLLVGLFFSAVVLLPITVWVGLTHSSGRNAARFDVCAARALQVFPSELKINGEIKHGRFLERSDRLSILLDQTSVHVVTVGDNPRLLDTTSLAHILCAPKT